MKIKLTLASGVGEDDVSKWSMGEENPTKRLGVEDTNSDSSGSEGLGDKSCTLWLLWYDATLRGEMACMCGVQLQICGTLVD